MSGELMVLARSQHEDYTAGELLAQRLAAEMGLVPPQSFGQEGDGEERSSLEHTLGTLGLDASARASEAFHGTDMLDARSADFNPTSGPFGSFLSQEPSMNFEWAADDTSFNTAIEEEQAHNEEYGVNLYQVDFPTDLPRSLNSALDVTEFVATREQAETFEVERDLYEEAVEAINFRLPTSTPLGDARATADIYVSQYRRLQGTTTAKALERKMQEVTKYFFFNCVLQVIRDLIELRVSSSLRFNSSSPSLSFPFDIEGASLIKGVTALIEELKTDTDLRDLSRLLVLSSQAKKRILYAAFDLLPELLRYTHHRTNKSRTFTVHVQDVPSLRATGSLSAIEAASADYLLPPQFS
eukprot:CAMPEP_0113899920 /NCGR_PEP_ID=MMETSP0780_2-20120614/20350_1 /TAXON_ID=652834 /ORGANISM="Palpitomonas bilix" /LENGTH=354 /DNA_ID=CAMNT_0000892243 /DNA_START=161 /DNA_END=1225 /DNA_ORIENTATION=+ /assembly_acc=CAM_ASM_000599